MLALLLLLLPCCGLALEQEKYARVYARVSTTQLKRQMATCEETYGAGSQPCGDPESTYCFNASLDQSCCATDSGFCDAGKYCAPVAGYCCLEGEDLATCAQNAGFVLPSSVSISASTKTSATVESTMASPTLTVVPFLKAPSAPMSTGTSSCRCSAHATSANLTAIPTFIPNANTTIPSYVQVSFAVERARALAGPVAIIGIVGVVCTFF